MNTTSHQAGSTIQIRQDGKASFDDVYDQPTPAAYFTMLRPLEYIAPDRAQPLVRRCVEALRQRRSLETVTVLDLCSGYGVNAALLKHRLTLRDLYRRFASRLVCPDHAERIADDARWFRRQRRPDAGVRVIAQDVARNALEYSRSVGLADAVVAANLEVEEPSPGQAALMRDAHLIIVTGGFSYIGGRTFRRLLSMTRRRPWALYFPLRHSDTSDIDEGFEDVGYAVETARRMIDHRRYRCEEERRAIHARIHAEAAPDDSPPSPKYLEALVKLARPEDELFYPPLEAITDGKDRHMAPDAARVGSAAPTRSGS